MDNALTEKRLSRERVSHSQAALSLPHSSQNENIQSFGLAVLSLPLCLWRHGARQEKSFLMLSLQLPVSVRDFRIFSDDVFKPK